MNLKEFEVKRDLKFFDKRSSSRLSELSQAKRIFHSRLRNEKVSVKIPSVLIQFIFYPKLSKNVQWFCFIGNVDF